MSKTKEISFFTVASGSEDDSDSSDEEDDSTNKQEIKSTNPISSSVATKTLPPPLMALASAKTPEFVTSHITDEMDWNRMVKKAPYVTPKEFKPWETALPPVETKSDVKNTKPDLALLKQVPPTLVPPKPKPLDDADEKPKEFVDQAISWSKMYKDDVTVVQKRPRPEDEDADLAGFCHTDVNQGKKAFHSKRKAPESFRDKEKRKRNTGQANREKMFVEEEKRVLRQGFDAS